MEAVATTGDFSSERTLCEPDMTVVMRVPSSALVSDGHPPADPRVSWLPGLWAPGRGAVLPQAPSSAWSSWSGLWDGEPRCLVGPSGGRLYQVARLEEDRPCDHQPRAPTPTIARNTSAALIRASSRRSSGSRPRRGSMAPTVRRTRRTAGHRQTTGRPTAQTTTRRHQRQHHAEALAACRRAYASTKGLQAGQRIVGLAVSGSRDHMTGRLADLPGGQLELVLVGEPGAAVLRGEHIRGASGRARRADAVPCQPVGAVDLGCGPLDLKRRVGDREGLRLRQSTRPARVR